MTSTTDDPIPVADGLSSSLDDQLDLATVSGGFPTLEIYENSAWLPTTSLLSGATAEASTTAGIEALLRANLTEAVPIMAGADQFEPSVADVTPGVVQLGVPFDEHWTLSLDGDPVEARRSFGISTAFDVATAGRAELRYDSPSSRSLLIAMQVLLWVAAIFIALKIRVPRGRRINTYSSDETLIVLRHDPLDAAVAAAPRGRRWWRTRHPYGGSDRREARRDPADPRPHRAGARLRGPVRRRSRGAGRNPRPSSRSTPARGCPTSTARPP